MAAQFPRIDVYTTDDMHKLSEQGRYALVSISDFLANLAPRLEKDLINTFRAEGIDGRSGLMGSEAKTLAKRATRPLYYCADLTYTGAQAMTDAWRRWNQHVVEPIAAARAARSGKSRVIKV